MNTVVVPSTMWFAVVAPIAWLLLVTVPLLVVSAWTRGKTRIRAQRARAFWLRDTSEAMQNREALGRA